MIIGGLTGTPKENRLTYVLPVVRVDHVTGERLDAGLMLASPMRGLVPDRPNRFPIDGGATSGGASPIPITEESEYEAFNLGGKQEST